MKLTIDNLDGAGAVDYSGALSAEKPLILSRSLNEPSVMSGVLDLNSGGWAVPVRRARVVVSSVQKGSVLFTGYLVTEPVPLYAGEGTYGPAYRLEVGAASDEWLLDKQTPAVSGISLGLTGAAVLTKLTERVDSLLFTDPSLVGGRSVGVFEPEITRPWSSNAGAVAGATYAAYRVLDRAVLLQPAGSVTHHFTDGDRTLVASAFRVAQLKELANDVTLTGAIEPAAYVAEVFAGDGATGVFQLSEAPFHENAAPLLSDSFNAGVFDAHVWQVSDPGGHLGFSAAGMQLTGGNGVDGQTTLTAIDPVELGGSVVVEAGSVRMDAGSDGVLCGLYGGTVQRVNCFAGWNVRQSAGATVIVAMINGAEVGTVFTTLTGHSYTLRIRLHCVEMQRVLQAYYARVDAVVEEFGGGQVPAPMDVVFEVIDVGLASNTPVTVLYDGAVAISPTSCNFAAVDSVQLFGSIGFCRVTRTGSAWVTSTLPSGITKTRLLGIAGEGVDATMAGSGKLTFFAGHLPMAGEYVTVKYRGSRRAVARMEDAASVAAEAAGGHSGLACWLGRVLRPAARSTADCESAALAVLSFAASRSAALAGSCTVVSPDSDVWPGDVLAITTNKATLNVIVRQVSVEDGSSFPELLTYRMRFANDWAEGLGLKLSETVAADALLPQTPLSSPSHVLANLQQMAVVTATGTALQVDAGMAPPVGGGFEVRRRDWDFGAGVEQDLVLRSPVRSFSIPRVAQVERYYVRMYDGSIPAVYSRFSSAVFTNLPVE